MLIKYCKREHNPKINLLSGIRLGTVPSYREANINSGVFDDEEGLLNYISDGYVSLTQEVSEKYFSNSIVCNGDGGLRVGTTSHDFILGTPLESGDDGWLKFHATKENPITMDVCRTFLIYSCSVENEPDIKKAKLIDPSYDSFYEISNISNFSRKLSNSLKSLASHLDVNFKYGLVDYIGEKFEVISNMEDHKDVNFSDRVLRTIFNKNTRHNHVYQNEFRIVFWFSHPKGGEWSSIHRVPTVVRPMHIRKDIGLFA
jgi:hypothetical protein